MKKLGLVLIVCVFLIGMFSLLVTGSVGLVPDPVIVVPDPVSVGNVFFDDFEDGIEWTNWEVVFGRFSNWYLDRGSNNMAEAQHWMGWSSFVLKKSRDLGGESSCKVSFKYKVADSGFVFGFPILTLDFYDGSLWQEIMRMDFSENIDALVSKEVAIDDSYLNENSKIRFNVSGGWGYVHIDDVSIDCAATEDMNVVLESPYCGEYVMIDSTSKIKIVATDVDNEITGNISVDGYVRDFDNGVEEFDYTWDRSGNIQIELFAENDGGYTRRQITSVMVVDPTTPDKYLAACMDEPSEFVNIASTNVYFNASSTMGIINESGTLKIVDKSDLLFSWRFSDGLINPNHEGSNELSYAFFKNFATAGHNWAILDVEMK